MRPQIMGIVNVTPDSFSDGGRFVDPTDAVAYGRSLLAEGADILDVGGESTRPGATPVSIGEELRRVVPVIDALAADAASAGVDLSVDTRHAEVARRAVAAGATIVNDVSSSLWPVAAETGCGYLAMHMQGDPQTMQDAPAYDDVVAEVLAQLSETAAAAQRAGVERCWIDPGIGFGKTADHNWALLAALDRFVDTGLPVCVGASRKGFLGAALARSDGAVDPTAPEDRLEGTLGTAVWAALCGAAVVRVHDVRATVQALTLVGETTVDSIVLPTSEVA